MLTKNELVLVAVMPNRRDMEIARVLGWYRIPLKNAPKILRADIIAFYQNVTFPNGHRSQIRKFAEIRGVELTTRAQLLKDQPEHPRAHEEYFKIQLGELQDLPTPIIAGSWKRFTFFYTTAEKLTCAVTVNDLALNSSEREIIWNTLRKRPEYTTINHCVPSTQPEITADAIFLLGNLSFSGLDLDSA